MKAILKFALAAAATYVLMKAALERADELQDAGQPGSDAANPPASVDDIPTLQAVGDGELQPPGAARDPDLKVEQSVPF